MKVLITGGIGFVGCKIIEFLRNNHPSFEIIAIDNLSRKGCHLNLSKLNRIDAKFLHCDIRSRSDLESIPKADWVIDCAANPSVLAGLNHSSSSLQLMENNLVGTLNLIEYCKRHNAGLILLSTSRVYSAAELSRFSVIEEKTRFFLDASIERKGLSQEGITEEFSTTPPLSLYGASKISSELLALEYGLNFNFPVWIDRCGVMAGAGQFGKADQGIISYWIHSFREAKPLSYIGFGGSGLQVRDALHPQDVAPLLVSQMQNPDKDAPSIINLGGGLENSTSLLELSSWCENRFGQMEILASKENRPMDAPWIVMDSSLASQHWDWKPEITIDQILSEIASHAEANPKWLDLVS